MSKNFALKKLKTKKQMQVAITLALTLTLAATLVTMLPIASGQLTQAVISMTASIWVQPNPVGVNQAVYVQGITYPCPEVTINHAYTITCPNGTVITKLVPTFDPLGGYESHFYFTPDQVGTWTFRLSWAGDATHRASSSTTTVTVQSTAVAALQKITPLVSVCTVPKGVEGLGQTIFLAGWINPPREVNGAVYWDLKFTVTKPNGNTQTIPIKNTDSPATCNARVVVDQLGQWTFKLSFAGDALHNAAESPPWTLTVQSTSVPAYPSTPLPTGQWKWPVSGEYYEWYQLTGPWPYNDAGVGISGYNAAGINFNAYTKAPNTAHVLWKLPMSQGGLIGGDQGYLGSSGSAPRPVAAHGRIYWLTSEHWINNTQGAGSAHPVLNCYDQYTGNLVYKRDLPGVGNPGKLYLEIKGSEGEIDPKLVARDPAAFSLWATVGYNQQGGTWEINPDTGDCLYYNPGITGWIPYEGYLFITGYNGTLGANQAGVTTKWDCRNKQTIWVKDIAGISNIADGLIVRRTQSTGGIPDMLRVSVWNATTGNLVVDGDSVGMYFPASENIVAYGKTYRLGMDRREYAISLTTGKVVWKSDQFEYPWGSFGMYWAAAAYNKVFQGTYDGYIYALNADNGNIVWKHFFGNTTEDASGTYNPWGGCWIADNKVYVATSEHSPAQPEIRGQTLNCLDANTGNLIWSIPFHCSSRGAGGISSGDLFAWSRYDDCLYMFGQGASATTVSGPTTSVPLGTGVLLQGTVTDQSAGAKDTPAIADADQSVWMQYLYMNAPQPANAHGVTVHLVAVSSNGVVTDVGHATTDTGGHYGLTWTPPAEDTYTIVASFEGSDSYYSSYGETGLSVGPAAASVNVPSANDIAGQVVSQLPTSEVPTPVPTVNVAELASQVASQINTAAPSVTGTDLAIIVAVVVVAIAIGVVNLVLLLKRKKS